MLSPNMSMNLQAIHICNSIMNIPNQMVHVMGAMDNKREAIWSLTILRSGACKNVHLLEPMSSLDSAAPPWVQVSD